MRSDLSQSFSKAVSSNADVICIDLEDVAPQDKDQAKNIIEALNNFDLAKDNFDKNNGLDTSYCYRDVIDVMENAGERLDLIMIPKLESSRGLLCN